MIVCWHEFPRKAASLLACAIPLSAFARSGIPTPIVLIKSATSQADISPDSQTVVWSIHTRESFEIHLTALADPYSAHDQLVHDQLVTANPTALAPPHLVIGEDGFERVLDWFQTQMPATPAK